MRPKTILAGGSGTDTSRKDSCAGTVRLIRLASRSLCGDDGPSNAVRLLQRKAEDGEVQTSQTRNPVWRGALLHDHHRDTLTHEILVLSLFFLFRIYARSSDISVYYSVLFLFLSHDVTLSCFLKRELLRLNGLVRVLLPSVFPTEFPDDMTFFAPAPQNILIRHESLEPNRTPRMDPSRADAHLGTKAIAKPVRETRARINEYTGRVDAAHKCAAG